jgi:hypothetical protein
MVAAVKRALFLRLYSVRLRRENRTFNKAIQIIEDGDYGMTGVVALMWLIATKKV